MPKKLNRKPRKFFLGWKDNERYYMEEGKWDCGWYWGLGYISSPGTHQHYDGIIWHKDEDGKYMYHLLDFLDECVLNEHDCWILSDYMHRLYALKEVSEVLHRGTANFSGSEELHRTKNDAMAEWLNEEEIPALLEKVYQLLLKPAEQE